MLSDNLSIGYSSLLAKNLKITGFLLLFLSALISKAGEEVRKYEIRVAGIHIGDMIAKKKTQDTLTIYSLDSNVSIWIFYSIKVHYTITSAYHSDQLLYSIVTTTTNKGNFNTSTIWNRDHYQVKVNAYKYKKDTVIRGPIRFNMARMYFEEPTVSIKLLSDNYGLILTPEKLDHNSWRCVLMGKPNQFYFSNGKLQRAQMYNPIKNFEVRLKE